MAGSILIPLKAVFDDKGVKDASRQFSKLGKTLKGSLGAVGLGIGLAAITSQLKQATKAAVEDGKSQGLLAQQLRNTVGATDQAIAANEQYISTLELTSNIADDTLRPALASLVRATGDVGKAQELLSISTDVAAGTGRDLGAVAIAVGRAHNGQTTALKRLGITVKAGEDPIKALGAAFKGNAEAAANLDPFQRLSVIFGRIQEQVGIALVPTLQNFANFMASKEGQGKIQEFVDVVTTALGGVVAFINFIADNFDTLVNLGTIIGTVAVAMGVLNIALNTNPIILAVGAVGLLVTAFMALNGQLDLVNNARPKSSAEAGQQAFDASLRAAERTPITNRLVNEGQARTVAEAARREAIKQFKIEAQGRGEAARYGALVNQFQTKTGVVFDPFAGAGKGGSKTAKSDKKTALELAAEKAAEALEKAKEVLQDFKDDIQQLGTGFDSLGQAQVELGQFQLSVIDTFDEINNKIAEGVAAKKFGDKGLDELRNFLKAQQNLLEENARQRDEIIQKRSLAKALFDEVQSALSGTGNLAGLLEKQTQQITTSVTKIVDGFTVTTKRTVEEVVGGNGVISKLQAIVTKTKAFALQLTNLKALGLDKDLFKQIVDAGPDVGGELATEILAGGASSVKALNDTFAELQTVTADVAEQTAVVMFNAGVEVTGGLVAGLLSEETRLINAAKQLAESFSVEFKKSIDALVLPNTADTAKTITYSLADIKLMNTAAGSPALAKSNADLANKLIARQAYTAYGTNVTVTVNAGLGANGKTIGQQIQAELNKYAKSSAN
jgi:hypothetical protein